MTARGLKTVAYIQSRPFLGTVFMTVFWAIALLLIGIRTDEAVFWIVMGSVLGAFAGLDLARLALRRRLGRTWRDDMARVLVDRRDHRGRPDA